MINDSRMNLFFLNGHFSFSFITILDVISPVFGWPLLWTFTNKPWENLSSTSTPQAMIQLAFGSTALASRTHCTKPVAGRLNGRVNCHQDIGDLEDPHDCHTEMACMCTTNRRSRNKSFGLLTGKIQSQSFRSQSIPQIILVLKDQKLD